MSFVPSNTFITIIAFVLLYLALNKWAFGPLFGIMEKRRQLILDQMNAAESNQKQSQESLVQQQEALDQARQEAYSILEQARTTSSKQAADIVQSAKAEADRLKDVALKDIESEKNKAIVALRSEVGEISVKIASKIMEKQVDEKSQEKLVNQYLKEVGSK